MVLGCMYSGSELNLWCLCCYLFLLIVFLVRSDV